VSKGPTLKVIRYALNMFYHYSAIPPFLELFDWPSYVITRCATCILEFSGCMQLWTLNLTIIPMNYKIINSVKFIYVI
jgi:hypothetical protein